MKIIEPSVTLMTPVDGEEILWRLEDATRNCYKSEYLNPNKDPKIRDGLIRRAVERNHTSVLEHASFTFRVICNRGVSHEWVRHRIGWSYSQESTRYCNYSLDRFGNEITVIWPTHALGPLSLPDFEAESSLNRLYWREAMRHAEESYFALLANGAKPDFARGVLPIDVKTEIVCTANIVALRHFFNKRCAAGAHPQIRELALQLLAMLSERVEIVFEDQARQFLSKT